MNKRILVDTKDYGQKAVDGFNLLSLEEHLYNKRFIETADQMMINAEQVIAFYYEVDWE